MSREETLDLSPLYNQIRVSIRNRSGNDFCYQVALSGLKAFLQGKDDSSFRVFEVVFPNQKEIYVSRYAMELLCAIWHTNPELPRPYRITSEFLSEAIQMPPEISIEQKYPLSSYAIPYRCYSHPKPSSSPTAYIRWLLPKLLVPPKPIKKGYLPGINYIFAVLEKDRYTGHLLRFAREIKDNLAYLRGEYSRAFTDEIYFSHTIEVDHEDLYNPHEYCGHFLCRLLGSSEILKQLRSNGSIQVLWLENIETSEEFLSESQFFSDSSSESEGDAEEMSDRLKLFPPPSPVVSATSPSVFGWSPNGILRELQFPRESSSPEYLLNMNYRELKPANDEHLPREKFLLENFRYVNKESMKWGDLGKYPFEQAGRLPNRKFTDLSSVVRENTNEIIYAYLRNFRADDNSFLPMLFTNTQVMYTGELDLHWFFNLEELQYVHHLDLSIYENLRIIHFKLRRIKHGKNIQVIVYYEVKERDSKEGHLSALNEGHLSDDPYFLINYYFDLQDLPQIIYPFPINNLQGEIQTNLQGEIQTNLQGEEYILVESDQEEPTVFFGPLYINTLRYFVERFGSETTRKHLSSLLENYRYKALLLHPKFNYSEKNLQGFLLNLIYPETYKYPILESGYIYPMFYGKDYIPPYPPRTLDNYILNQAREKLLATGIDLETLTNRLAGASSYWFSLERENTWTH